MEVMAASIVFPPRRRRLRQVLLLRSAMARISNSRFSSNSSGKNVFELSTVKAELIFLYVFEY